MGYRVNIWYAEHASEGDKFYKVMEITAETARRAFSIYQYGKRALHVDIESASTGVVSCDTQSKPTGAGRQTDGAKKKAEKTGNGYTRNTQKKNRDFSTRDELIAFVRSKVSKDKASAAVNIIRDSNFAEPGVTDVAAPIQAPPVESRLHESEHYGTW